MDPVKVLNTVVFGGSFALITAGISSLILYHQRRLKPGKALGVALITAGVGTPILYYTLWTLFNLLNNKLPPPFT